MTVMSAVPSLKMLVCINKPDKRKTPPPRIRSHRPHNTLHKDCMLTQPGNLLAQEAGGYFSQLDYYRSKVPCPRKATYSYRQGRENVSQCRGATHKPYHSLSDGPILTVNAIRKTTSADTYLSRTFFTLSYRQWQCALTVVRQRAKCIKTKAGSSTMANSSSASPACQVGSRQELPTPLRALHEFPAKMTQNQLVIIIQGRVRYTSLFTSLYCPP